MERLTKRDVSGAVIQMTVSGTGRRFHADEVFLKLAAYEDTGLDPEEVLGSEQRGEIVRAIIESNTYRAIGTVEHLTELVNTEQQRQEGCRRCWNGECTMSGFDYSCETTCDKCRYNLKDKQFCPHCGRDLKGESHND